MCLKRFLLLSACFLLIVNEAHTQTYSSEWIEVYFNMPAGETDKYPGIESNHSWDLIGTLVSLIDSASTSVDLCIYDLENPRISDALVQAKSRGVRIRVVTDNHNRNDGYLVDEAMWLALGNAGIISIDDDGDIYRSATDITDHRLVNAGADMHNKFAVIDKLSPSTGDDIVWTGSTNLTYTGAYNTNNVVVIKDADVAQVYTEEFEQMWGGDVDEPDPLKSRFHKDKNDVSEHIFDVGGTRVEIYFAPVNRSDTKPSISDRLVELLENEAQSDIKFQAFSITPDIPISKAMWSISDTSDVTLEGVIDPGFYSRYRNAGDIWGSPEAQIGNRKILPARETRKLHHKVMVIDADNPNDEDQAVVVTGSYNFSNNAEYNNDENLLIIFSDTIAAQYALDFEGAMQRAEGKLEAPAPPVEVGIWHEVYAIRDGSYFEVEVMPGFGYPVRLLGVDIPSIFSGRDSADYFAGPSADYLRNVLEGRKVRIKGYDGTEPESRYGAYRAYVEVDIDGEAIPLNKLILERGYGTYSVYYRQDPDSVEKFKKYEATARVNEEGMWKSPEKVGTRVPRGKEASQGDAVEVVYPININTADQATLELLPGIGETYARRIIDYRETNGGFKAVDELINIKGIGPKRFEKLRPVVTI